MNTEPPIDPWFSFSPLLNSLSEDWDSTKAIKFSERIYLSNIPDWARTDEALQMLGNQHREALRQGSHGLCANYRAAALGSPDPDFPGRGIQDSIFEELTLASLSLWLTKPVPIFTGLFGHVRRDGDYAILRQFRILPPFFIGEEQSQATLSPQDAEFGTKLYSQIIKLDRKRVVWTAINLIHKAASEQLWNIRFLVFAMALESLFGPQDGREITFRMSSRIACFLDNPERTKKVIYPICTKLYDWRSKIVHGMRLQKLTPEKSTELMIQIESLLRSIVKKILLEDFAQKFDSKGNGREQFLDDMVLS